jgi:enamine deaminase RidA (YjgF/YER057c/UK114 family)
MQVEPVVPPGVAPSPPHFSTALRSGPFVFVSGLSARSDDRSEVIGVGDAAIQTTEILRKLAVILAEAGGAVPVRTDVFVRRSEDQPVVAKVRAAATDPGVPPPTSTMVVVEGFPDPDYLVEMSVIAVLPAPVEEHR